MYPYDEVDKILKVRWSDVGIQRKKSVEERFWEKVSVGDDSECWEWLASKNQCGYGTFRFFGKDRKSHRVSWILTYGEIFDDMCVLHRCDNPGCVNFNHLFLGTHQDNMNDREKKGRNKLPLCKGEDHGISKLKCKEVKKIRELYKNSEYNQSELGNIFGVSQATVGKIVRRITWDWLE